MNANLARTITDILSDVSARSGLFGNSLLLTTFGERDVALKTGTSNDYRDAWAMGYTPSLVVGVWAGNNDNTAMHKQGSSILAAVPIWSAFLQDALKKLPSELFSRPEPIPPSSAFIGGQFLPGGQLHSELFWIDRGDPSGPQPADPTQDPQFNNWEAALFSWASANTETLASQFINTSSTAGFQPLVLLASPKPGGRADGIIAIHASIFSSSLLREITVRWNGGDVLRQTPAGARSFQLSAPFTPQQILPQNLLEVFATDELGNVGSARAVLFAPDSPQIQI